MRRPLIIAHHLIWTLYGHWLPNDLRGSGSEGLRQEKLVPLGAVHQGRKPALLQPTRQELRAFQRQAEPMLAHPRFWIRDSHRTLLADAFAEVIKKQNYTVWACAILSNHVHVVIRKHRDDALTMWHAFADAARDRLRDSGEIAADHPVWSSRPYKVFLPLPATVWHCVAYVEKNPEKEGLSRQEFAFVKEYDNWPFHKT